MNDRNEEERVMSQWSERRERQGRRKTRRLIGGATEEIIKREEPIDGYDATPGVEIR